MSSGYATSMATRITWDPKDIVPDFYEVKSAPSATGVFTLKGIVLDARPGPNWAADVAKFFYDDPDGEDVSVYRVQGFQNGGLLYDSGIFQPEYSKAALIQTRTRVDHNYLMPNALQYTAANGAPIEGANIRAFTKPDYDAGRTAVALFVTTTNSQGQWSSPFWLEPGLTYVLVFEKVGFFGPDTTEIVV